MGQFSKVLLAIDNVHTVPQRALDCGPGLQLCYSHKHCCWMLQAPNSNTHMVVTSQVIDTWSTIIHLHSSLTFIIIIFSTLSFMIFIIIICDNNCLWLNNVACYVICQKTIFYPLVAHTFFWNNHNMKAFPLNLRIIQKILLTGWRLFYFHMSCYNITRHNRYSGFSSGANCK